jgi:hypothetical protein
MSFLTEFQSRLPPDHREIFLSLRTPFAIQEYLDRLDYVGEERNRSPLDVMLDGQSHCLDGGLLAALALWRIGFKPLLVDMVPEPGKDDDHVLALYQVDGRWGALAKTNYINLGFREPVYKNLRELVMTYFEHYVSIHQEKALRGYTRPMDASRYTHLHWAWDEAGANTLYNKYFYGRPAIPLITRSMAKRLSPVTDHAYAAETLYTDLSQSFGNRDSTSGKSSSHKNTALFSHGKNVK